MLIKMKIHYVAFESLTSCAKVENAMISDNIIVGSNLSDVSLLRLFFCLVYMEKGKNC